jgi:S-adenosylmethionine hydrolase
VRVGDILLYEDSYWNVAIAINGGSAAEMLGGRPGSRLRIRLVP